MITLLADNRVLAANAKFSYLVDNSPAGVASFEIANTEPFTVGTPVLIGEFGKTDAEILKVTAINGETVSLGDLNSNPTTTTYSHPESTKITALQFNQIRFFWTAATGTIADETPVFSDGTPLTDWEEMDPSSYYSSFADVGHSSGFGWFMYRNIDSTETSQESNPIPYAGFTGNTALAVFSDFDSLLNVNELKLVTIGDKFSWLNEALAIVKNKLNLTNVEYTVSTPQTINVLAGTAEYQLPADFSDLVEIVNSQSDPRPIDFIPASQIMSYTGSEVKYYLRNRYIGFAPTPTVNATYYYSYRGKATSVNNISTYIDLPDNAFYALKDWMMYRACNKFSNPMATQYITNFTNSINLFMQSAVKRNANLDTWGIDPASNA